MSPSEKLKGARGEIHEDTYTDTYTDTYVELQMKYSESLIISLCSKLLCQTVSTALWKFDAITSK